MLYDDAGTTLGETRFVPQDYIVTDTAERIARIVPEAEFVDYVPV